MCLCAHKRVCGKVVTLWMTSFRGTINRECPWAVDISYEFSLERQQAQKKEWKAFEGVRRKVNAPECVMCVCVQFKSQI